MLKIKQLRKNQINHQVMVCERAEEEIPYCKGENYERFSLMMDLDSIPDLDLGRLLVAPKFDFTHDICGIMQHMDRSKFPGKLKDFFEPRCGRVK